MASVGQTARSVHRLDITLGATPCLRGVGVISRVASTARKSRHCVHVGDIGNIHKVMPQSSFIDAAVEIDKWSNTVYLSLPPTISFAAWLTAGAFISKFVIGI